MSTAQNDLMLLLVGAILGGLLLPLMGRWYSRPILVFKRFDDILVGHKGQAFHRLLVRNRGRTAATRCSALISLWPIAPGQAIAGEKTFHSSGAFARRPRLEHELLCWSKSGNPPEITIYPHSGARVDLFMAQFDETGRPDVIFIPSEEGWSMHRIALVPGLYRGRILVSGENTHPHVLYFEIDGATLFLGRYGRRLALAKIAAKSLPNKLLSILKPLLRRGFNWFQTRVVR